MICLMDMSKIPGEVHTPRPVAFPLPSCSVRGSDELSSRARLSFIMGGWIVADDLLVSFSPPLNRFRHSSRPSRLYDPN